MGKASQFVHKRIKGNKLETGREKVLCGQSINMDRAPGNVAYRWHAVTCKQCLKKNV